MKTNCQFFWIKKVKAGTRTNMVNFPALLAFRLPIVFPSHSVLKLLLKIHFQFLSRATQEFHDRFRFLFTLQYTPQLAAQLPFKTISRVNIPSVFLPSGLIRTKLSLIVFTFPYFSNVFTMPIIIVKTFLCQTLITSCLQTVRNNFMFPKLFQWLPSLTNNTHLTFNIISHKVLNTLFFIKSLKVSLQNSFPQDSIRMTVAIPNFFALFIRCRNYVATPTSTRNLSPWFISTQIDRLSCSLPNPIIPYKESLCV